MGNSGIGKTYLATVLDIKLKKAISANQLNFYKRRFNKYDLALFSELGYILFDRWKETFKYPSYDGLVGPLGQHTES